MQEIKKREKRTQNLFSETITENFLGLKKELVNYSSQSVKHTHFES